jgi:hypothetical protein
MNAMTHHYPDRDSYAARLRVVDALGSDTSLTMAVEV